MLVHSLNSVLRRFHQTVFDRVLTDPKQHVATAVVVALLVGCLGFGFELTNPTLGVDDYLHLQAPETWQPFWVERGMWGGLLVHYLTPAHWITPFITLVFGIGIHLLTGVFVGWVVGYPSDRLMPLIIFYAVWITFPYFAAQMAFSYLQLAYPLSSLAVVLGLATVTCTTPGPGRLMLGGLLVAFGISVYQGSISLLIPSAVLAFGAKLLTGYHSGHFAWHAAGRLLLRHFAVIVLGALLYFVLHNILLILTGVTPASETYSVTFHIAFWERWRPILANVVFLALGAGNVIPPFAVLLASVTLLLTGIFVARKHGPVFFAIVTGTLFISMLSVFSVEFIHHHHLAPRSAVGLGVVWAVLLSSPMLLNSKRLNTLTAGLAALVISIFVFQINAMFYAQYLVQEADKIMVARIIERVDQLFPGHKGAAQKAIIAIGSYSHPEHASRVRYAGSVIGFSNFEWDSGNPWRMQALARSVGLDGYEWEKSKGEELSQLLAGRQPWPGPESVFLYEGKAVVWLGAHRPASRKSSVELWFERL